MSSCPLKALSEPLAVLHPTGVTLPPQGQADCASTHLSVSIHCAQGLADSQH